MSDLAKNRNEDNNAHDNTNDSTINTNAALCRLIDKTGYQMIQENGQRKFGGPPPDWQGPAPPKGCEIFVGKIPRDCFEDELHPIFESAGKLYEMRLMMDFSGSNRGYAFVMYTNPEDAKNAIKQLNNYQIRPNKYIGVVKSVDNCRLFVGGIPKTKTKSDIKEEMAKITDGVIDVILYNSPKDKSKNRGFAFIEYESHRAAAIARRNLIPGRIRLWGQAIVVDWAEPEPEVDEETMSRVKVLYVRNLMENTTEEVIREKFQDDSRSVEKVKKLRDFAFVHFANREDAQSALNSLNGSELDGAIIEVTWAKPADKAKNYYRLPAASGISQYGQSAFTVDPYQVSHNSLNPAHSLVTYPATAGRGEQYGMRSPGRGRGRGAAGLRGSRGYYGGVGTYNRSSEYPRYDFHGYHCFPTNQLPVRTKPPLQMLAEFCQKNNLGEPQYQLGTAWQAGPNNTTEELYCYKVAIPQLGTYTSRHFYHTAEEAKYMAAQTTLGEITGANGFDYPAYYEYAAPPAFAVPAAAAHF